MPDNDSSGAFSGMTPMQKFIAQLGAFGVVCLLLLLMWFDRKQETDILRDQVKANETRIDHVREEAQQQGQAHAKGMEASRSDSAQARKDVLKLAVEWRDHDAKERAATLDAVLKTIKDSMDAKK